MNNIKFMFSTADLSNHFIQRRWVQFWKNILVITHQNIYNNVVYITSGYLYPSLNKQSNILTMAE